MYIALMPYRPHLLLLPAASGLLAGLLACQPGSGGSCSDADDEDRSNTALTIRVTNSTAAPVWLPGNDCLDFSRLTLHLDGLEAVDNAGEDGSNCQHLLSTPACEPFGCEGDGAIGGVVRIGPGESWEFAIQSYAYVQVEIPADCHTDASCAAPISCNTGREIQPGTQLDVSIVGHTECPDADACTCAADETCELPNSELLQLSGATTTASASLVYGPDVELIELTFE